MARNMASDSNSSVDPSYFQTHVLSVYKRALQYDINVCLFEQSSCGRAYSFDHPMYGCKTFVVGSCADGGATTRLYMTPPVVEMDMMYLLVRHHIPDVGLTYSDKAGVRYYPEFSKKTATDMFREGFQGTAPLAPSPDSPQCVKDALRNKPGRKNHSAFMPKWHTEKLDFLPNFARISLKGPSHKITAHIFGNKMLFDNVFAHHYQGWPKEAEEWRTRQRQWPPPSVVEEVIQQGYQVVMKQTSSAGDLEGPVDMHITFALCERFLARQRTPLQKVVYLMAKTLFYTYLEISDETNPHMDFPSYALKTCMMWLMEQTCVEEWTQDNAQLLLHMLFTMLYESVEKGVLKNYFMTGTNILHNCTPGLLKRVGKSLESILCDITSSLQATRLYKANVLLYGYHVLRGGVEAYDRVLYRCQNQVLKSLLNVMVKLHQVRATYKRIIEILEHGTGQGLKARGFLFDEEECFTVLKAILNIHSDIYMHPVGSLENSMSVAELFSKLRKFGIDEPIRDMFGLDQHLADIQITLTRLEVAWSDTFIPYPLPFPSFVCGNTSINQNLFALGSELYAALAGLTGEKDVLVVKEGASVKAYKWSSIVDLMEHFNAELRDEADKWMPRIHELTHQDIPELQQFYIEEMNHLMYDRKEKRDPAYWAT